MLKVRVFRLLVAVALLIFASFGNLLAQTKTNVNGTGGIHEIRGRIYAPDGTILDSPVQITLESTTFPSLSLLTDSSASYSFKNLAPGNYTVVINAGDRFETAREPVLIDGEIRGPNRITERTKVFTVPVYLQFKRSVRTEETGVINAKWIDIPKDAVHSLEKGTEEASRKELDKAEADYKKAIEIAPNYAPAYLALGKLDLTQGKLDEAISNLHLAIHYDLSDFESRLTLGFAFLNRNDLDGAKRELTEAARLNRTAVMPRYYLGLVHMQRRETDAAKKEFEAAKEMIADHVFPLLHRFLGIIYAAKQMNKEAIAELETYLKQDPKARDTDQVKQAIADLRRKINTTDRPS